jgi:hypothetical protein
MNNARLVLGAAALGAGVAYMLDPHSGRRRRTVARHKLVRAARVTSEAFDTTARDLANRGRGLLAASRAKWRDEEVSDEVLAERVRAKLGRWSSNPRAIQVDAHDGQVVLSGPMASHEARALLEAVPSIRGVTSVVDELDQHEVRDATGSLLAPTSAHRLPMNPQNWTPTTQTLVAAAGLAATGLCMALYTRRGEP